MGAKVEQATADGDTERYDWQLIGPRDPDQLDRLGLLLRSIAQRRRWRQQYDQAKTDVTTEPKRAVTPPKAAPSPAKPGRCDNVAVWTPSQPD